MKNIYVTYPFLPPRDEFIKYVDDIYRRCILTNDGPLVCKLSDILSRYCEVQNLHYVANGTIALQLALRALGITSGEVITTPFTYVATISSILWERCKPVFVDIEPKNFTIDAKKIERAITKNTKAIMPVHVFGYACDVDSIQSTSKKYNIPVIYDAAHAFGVKYKGKMLCSYGDISTLSFHATKLFHTIEGGACLTNDDALSFRIEWMRKFGHGGDDHMMLGINAKQDEFNAAMGLANFTYISSIIKSRKKSCLRYDSNIGNTYTRPASQEGLEYNFSYYPILFPTQDCLLSAVQRLNRKNIYPRRYFYPSLNTLPYLSYRQSCPVSEDISQRILCLPLWHEMPDSVIDNICECL